MTPLPPSVAHAPGGAPGGGFGGFDFEGFRTGAGGVGGIEDIFEMFFGGGAARAHRTGPQKGRDLLYPIDLTLEEVVTGVDKTVRVQRHAHCSKCHGSGGEPGSQPVTCDRCGGSGQVALGGRQRIPKTAKNMMSIVREF